MIRSLCRPAAGRYTICGSSSYCDASSGGAVWLTFDFFLRHASQATLVSVRFLLDEAAFKVELEPSVAGSSGRKERGIFWIQVSRVHVLGRKGYA